MNKRESTPDADSQDSEAAPSTKPLHRVQFGSVSAAVFANTRKRKDGGEYQDYSISLQRSYRDQEGEWQRSSINFYRREVMAAIEALSECFKATYQQSSSQPSEEEEL